MKRPTRLTFVFCCVFSTGCVSQFDYTPNATAIEEIGAASQEITVLLSRAVSPSHWKIQVSEEAVSFQTEEIRGFSGMNTARIPRTIHYTSVDHVDLYENGKAFVIDVNGKAFWRIRFGSTDDCKRFADLLISLKNWKGPWPKKEKPKAPPVADSTPTPKPKPDQTPPAAPKSDAPG